MIASVVQIGNSRGIRLSKSILRELGIEKEVEIKIHNNALIIKNIKKKPREDWSEAFSKMAKAKEDKLLLNDSIDSEAFDWVW